MPRWRGHFALATLRESEDTKEVGLAGGEVVDGSLQPVADVDDRVVGDGDVLVRLPDPDLVPGERFFLDAWRNVSPCHSYRRRIDSKHLKK